MQKYSWNDRANFSDSSKKNKSKSG